MSEFQIRKDNYLTHRIVEIDLSQDELQENEVIVNVDKFGLSANNITYAVVGDMLGYWQFFPPHTNDEVWGVLPVWGFANVTRSNNPEVKVGERIFGYFPPSTQLKLKPTHVSDLVWVDGSLHRQKLPQGYNLYRRVEAEPSYHPSQENERMLLFPLHITAFALYDFFASKSWFGAQQIVLISASSKTSTGMAYGIQKDQNAPYSIGLTSPNNVETVKGFDAYDAVISYDDLEHIDASKPTTIVDMSGNKAVIGRLHKHLGDNMTFCSNVGFTHWTEGGKNPDIIQERSEMFFAPTVIQQRIQDWGMDGFNQKSAEYLAHSYACSRNWLKMTDIDGITGMQSIFDDLCHGKLPAEKGLIVKL
jgi:hypothetical protein